MLGGLASALQRSRALHVHRQVGGGQRITSSIRKLREVRSSYDAMSDALKDAVYNGEVTSADATEILNCLLNALDDLPTRGGQFHFLHGLYYLNNPITNLRSNTDIVMNAAVKIQQVTADKSIFKATLKDNVWFHGNGAILHGQGAWSAAWVGNGGHEDRGIQFIGCTNSGVRRMRIRNCAHAAVAIVGGESIWIDKCRLEGTHLYSTPLVSGNNFQMGAFVVDDVTYGSPKQIDIDADISGAAQGVVLEHNAGLTDNATSLRLRGHIHDIPGQHAGYFQNGNVDVDITVKTIALSACKIQSNNAGQNIKGFRCRVVGSGISSNLFEVATLSTGSVADVHLVGMADAVLVGLALQDKVENLYCEMELSNVASTAFLAQGANQSDIEVHVKAKTIQADGVLISATNSNYRIYPVLRQSNDSSSGTGCGIRVSSASATVDLFDPVATDSNTRQVYGLFNQTAGSVVRVHGSATFTGGSDTAVRATGLISEWPTETTLSGTNGAFTSPQNVQSSQEMKVDGQSTSAVNVIIWQRALDDESAYLIEVCLTGKLSTSAERAAYKFAGVFYRDGGGIATLQGAIDTDVSIASGGFAGAYELAVNGANDVYLRVNSGGATTYNWQARVKVTKVS